MGENKRDRMAQHAHFAHIYTLGKKKKKIQHVPDDSNPTELQLTRPPSKGM